MGLFHRDPHALEPDESDGDDQRQLGDEPPVDESGRRSFEDHRDYLLSMVEPLAPFGMSLLDAWGRTLCEDIKGYSDVPPVPVAEVDGYAVRYADVVATKQGHPVLLVAGSPRRAVTPDDDDSGDDEPVKRQPATAGQATLVQAGQDMPEGTDTVVASGDAVTDRRGSRITVRARVAEGDWVRPMGVEAQDGELLMAAGTVLDDRRSALLAAAGFDRVMARPRTRVTVVQVTDSQAEPSDGARVATYGIHMANGMAKADGATVWRAEIDLTDLSGAHERLSDELVRSDMMMTIGAISDSQIEPRLVELFEGLGVVNTAEVAMRPGIRHGFGLIGDDDTPLVMLPGDPLSLLVAYHGFARPVLRKLMGTEPFSHEAMLCFAERDMDAQPGLTQFVPCRLRQDGNRYLASEITGRRHSWLTTLVEADALVMIPQNKHRVYAGEPMACWLLGDQRTGIG